MATSKYTRVLKTKLISKIPKGTEIPVPTRPKRAKDTDSEFKTGITSASRTPVGMMDVIDHIGSTSGIDAVELVTNGSVNPFSGLL